LFRPGGFAARQGAELIQIDRICALGGKYALKNVK